VCPRPWHVGQCEEPVLPQGRVLCVDPIDLRVDSKEGRPVKNDFFVYIHINVNEIDFLN